MAKTLKAVLLGLSLGLWGASALQAEDKGLSGVLSLRGSAGAAAAVAGDHFRHRSGVGPSLGGAMLLGLTPSIGVFAAYDRPQAGRWLESESVTGGVRLSLLNSSGWTPFLETGAGIGRQDSSHAWKRLALKADVGVEKMLCPQVSLGALLGYHYIDGRSSFSHGSLHELAPSAFAAYHFGR